jgi:replicative DNA helicase
MSFGIPKLDEDTDGMKDGQVTVVGARSGVGKSSIMLQAAHANCRKEIPVLLFSLEMTREQCLRRLWAIESGVPF